MKFVRNKKGGGETSEREGTRGFAKEGGCEERRVLRSEVVRRKGEGRPIT